MIFINHIYCGLIISYFFQFKKSTSIKFFELDCFAVGVWQCLKRTSLKSNTRIIGSVPLYELYRDSRIRNVSTFHDLQKIQFTIKRLYWIGVILCSSGEPLRFDSENLWNIFNVYNNCTISILMERKNVISIRKGWFVVKTSLKF